MYFLNLNQTPSPHRTFVWKIEYFWHPKQVYGIEFLFDFLIEMI